MAFVPPARELYAAGLAIYALGIAGGLAAHFRKGWGSRLAGLLCCLALAGAVLEFSASLAALSRPATSPGPCRAAFRT